MLGEFLFREPYGIRERQHIALKPGIPKFQNDRALPPVALPVNLYPFVGITKIGVNHPGTQHRRFSSKEKRQPPYQTSRRSMTSTGVKPVVCDAR